MLCEHGIPKYGFCLECCRKAAEDAKRPLDRLVMRPGPGWKHLAGPVWEHTTGTRIHTMGLVRLPDKTHIWINHFDAGKLGRWLVRANGGNRKRGLMAWAMNLVGA